ncbi:MAG: hypothetical protein OCC49_17000 [Fibrobacterales bacterium]
MLPLPIHYLIIRLLFVFKQSLFPRVVQRIQYRISRVPGLKPDLWNIFRNSWFNTIAMTRHALNPRSVAIDFFTKNDNTLLSDNQNHIVFGIHSGAFELMHLALAHANKPVYVITEMVQNPLIHDLVAAIRGRRNLYHLTPEQFVKEYRTIVSRPSIVALVIDQGRGSPSGSVCIEQLEVPYFAKLIHRLHNKGFLVHSISTVPQTVKRHSLIIKSFNVNLHKSLVVFVEGTIKKTIVMNPNQWIWHYPRFTEKN